MKARCSVNILATGWLNMQVRAYISCSTPVNIRALLSACLFITMRIPANRRSFATETPARSPAPDRLAGGAVLARGCCQ